MTFIAEETTKGINQKQRYKFLQNILKGNIRDKLKNGFPFARLKWSFMEKPEPKLSVIYSPIPDYEWKFLAELDNAERPETLIGILTELSEAIFIQTARKWQRQYNYKINIKTMSSTVDHRHSSNDNDKWYEIEITTSVASDLKAGLIVNDLLKWFVKMKYSFEVKKKKDINKQFFEYVLPVMKELQVNRFIKYETTNDIQPLVAFKKIESYLQRRIKNEPRQMKCIHCKKTAYVFKNKQTFCFNPSCRVLILRKKKEKQS